VALRPVSELGLVDVTDLASREADITVTRRSSARARSGPQAPRDAVGKDSREDRTVDQSQKPRASTGTGRKAGGDTTNSVVASTTKSSRRSDTPAAGKAKRPDQPGGQARSSSGTSKTASSRSRTNSSRTAEARTPDTTATTPKRSNALGNGSRGSSAAARQSHGEIKALAANLGIGVVTGAIGVAGGVLMVRTARQRQRQRRILGISLSA
jgi:hypothetical protein